MSDDRSAACAHDPAQFVTADEGTSFCPACEAEARYDIAAEVEVAREWDEFLRVY